jgi:enediyne biosynthesis protein E4
LLLRNKTKATGHWLRIKAAGTRSNRDGFGARIQVKAGGLTQTAEVRSNSSFLSASDPRVYFGLGSATRVDSIEVRWPSGALDRVGTVPADEEVTIQEGKGVVPGQALNPARGERQSETHKKATQN